MIITQVTESISGPVVFLAMFFYRHDPVEARAVSFCDMVINLPSEQIVEEWGWGWGWGCGWGWGWLFFIMVVVVIFVVVVVLVVVVVVVVVVVFVVVVVVVVVLVGGSGLVTLEQGCFTCTITHWPYEKVKKGEKTNISPFWSTHT